MEENGKQINPYRGVWIGFLVNTLAPILVFFLLYFVVKINFTHPTKVNIDIALGFSGAVGALIALSCLLRFIFDRYFIGLSERIEETRLYFGRVFCKEGFKWYFGKFIEEGGIIMLVLIVMLLAFAAVSVYGFVSFGYWYASIK